MSFCHEFPPKYVKYSKMYAFFSKNRVQGCHISRFPQWNYMRYTSFWSTQDPWKGDMVKIQWNQNYASRELCLHRRFLHRLRLRHFFSHFSYFSVPGHRRLRSDTPFRKPVSYGFDVGYTRTGPESDLYARKMIPRVLTSNSDHTRSRLHEKYHITFLDSFTLYNIYSKLWNLL